MTDRPPSVFIDRAPEVVFGYLIGLNDAGWRSPFPEMKLVSESYEGVGAAHIEVRKVLGRRIETLAETVIYEPDRRWAVRRASGPIRPQVTYTLRPEGNGTRLWFEFGVPVLEGMARRLSRGRPGAISKDSSRLSNVTDRRDGRSKGEHSMTTRRLGNEAGARSPSFERFAGFCAILAGVSDLLYAVSFLTLQTILLSGLFLMLGGLLTSAALIAVYERLRETDASFALLALVLGLASSLGSAVHGGYDLANAVNPPPSLLDLPNPVD
ncbi:MAG TPA: hypothetical protein VFI90_19045, partial [Rubrobacter sp.]|nr:hypothetical protein [Rubrobacter sp.]